MTRTVVRVADLTNDRQELISFLCENLTKDSNATRFDWLYVHSPFGQARAWIASDSLSGRTIGAAAAFPRHFRSGTSEHRAWVLGDFCIAKEARSLGPALQVQRACLTFLGDDPWYDFPSQSMMAIYKRLGTFKFEEQVRYAKLLRIDSKVETFAPRNSVGNAIRFAGNALLRLGSGAHVAKGLELSQLEGPFNREFDDLNLRLSANVIQGSRTADFLNWRYRQHPFQKFIVTVAKRHGELLGYAVLATQDGNGTICDLNAVNEDEVVPALLGYVEHILLRGGAHTISAPTNASRFRKYFRSAGFRPRESCSIVIHGASALSGNWLMQPGDRDS